MFAWPGSPSDAVRIAAGFVHSLHTRVARGEDASLALAAELAATLSPCRTRVGEAMLGISAPAGFVERATAGDGLVALHPGAETALAAALARCERAGTITSTLRLNDACARLAPGFGDAMVSVRRTAPGRAWAVIVERPEAQGPVPEAECDAVAALMGVVGDWVWARVGSSALPEIVVRAAGPARPEGGERLLARLTPAQRGVLPYLLEGRTEADIGKLIFRSRYTVHDHARAIYAALGVRNRVELVLLCNRVGLTVASLRAAETVEPAAGAPVGPHAGDESALAGILRGS